jgi:hypothetical protein
MRQVYYLSINNLLRKDQKVRKDSQGIYQF